MKSLALLLALTLLSSCGTRTVASIEYVTLHDHITECVDAAWGDALIDSIAVGHGGVGNERGHFITWEYEFPLSDVTEAELADRLSDLHDRLTIMFAKTGAQADREHIGRDPDKLLHFGVTYTSESESGLVWARRVNHRNGTTSIFIIFHGVPTN